MTRGPVDSSAGSAPSRPPVPRSAMEYLRIVRPGHRHRADLARRRGRRRHERRRRQLRVLADVGARARGVRAVRTGLAHRALSPLQPARRGRRGRPVPPPSHLRAAPRDCGGRHGPRVRRLHDRGHRRGVREPVPRRPGVAVGRRVQRRRVRARVPSRLRAARVDLQGVPRRALDLVRRLGDLRRLRSGRCGPGTVSDRDARNARALQSAAGGGRDDWRRRRLDHESRVSVLPGRQGLARSRVPPRPDLRLPARDDRDARAQPVGVDPRGRAALPGQAHPRPRRSPRAREQRAGRIRPLVVLCRYLLGDLHVDSRPRDGSRVAGDPRVAPVAHAEPRPRPRSNSSRSTAPSPPGASCRRSCGRSRACPTS